MDLRILYVERKPSEYVSIEKAFREIALGLPAGFEPRFQQVPCGFRLSGTIGNLLFFRKQPADIYHITGQINYMALLFSPKNTVLSIMDVRFVHSTKGLRKFLLKKLYLDLPLWRLRYVTAISSHVRDEIIAHTNCDPAKVRILDLPLISSFADGPAKPFNKAKPVILQVGTLENKNIPNLARALDGIKCQLRIVGRMNSFQIDALLANKVDYVNLKNLTDSELRSEYANADIVAFCSTYEGFGLPIIEGQAMRKPVITSNLSPLRETAGPDACLVDPFDHMSIREGIERIIRDDDYRRKLIESGRCNAARFSSTSVAQQYADLYKEIMIRET